MKRISWCGGRCRFLLSFLIAFLLLDAFLFRFFLWQIPDETAWESEPLYRLEFRLRQLEGKEKRAPRILVIGSSVAAYSILERRLEEGLRKRGIFGPRVTVHQLGCQGMNTRQLLPLADRLLTLRPDLLILPLNMVDFRLERPLALGVMDDLTGPNRRRALSRLEEDIFYDRRQHVFSPLGLLHCCMGELDWNGRSRTLLSLLVASYRYRRIGFVGLTTFLKNRFRRGHSYLNYAGIPVGGEGITHRGRTGKTFRLPVTAELIERGLELEAPQQLFASGQRVYLDMQLFSSAPGEGKALLLHRRLRLRRGWQNIKIPSISADILLGRLSTLYYSQRQADRLGVRLARNIGIDPARAPGRLREKRREDELYLNYSDEEYNQSFRSRILRFDRRGMEYLQALKMAREVWASREFDQELPTVRAFDLFRQKLIRHGTELLVINAPENPESLTWYENSRWYKGYLRFLSEDSGSGHYHFTDTRSLLRRQHFYDYHHLSWYGAGRFTDRLLRLIEEKFSR